MRLFNTVTLTQQKCLLGKQEREIRSPSKGKKKKGIAKGIASKSPGKHYHYRLGKADVEKGFFLSRKRPQTHPQKKNDETHENKTQLLVRERMGGVFAKLGGE